MNTNENQMKLKEMDDLNSNDLSSVEFIKKCYGDSLKKTQAQDFKFLKNLVQNFFYFLKFLLKMLRVFNLKAKLNEQVPEENDHIITPDIVLTAQLSQGLNNKKTPNVSI